MNEKTKAWDAVGNLFWSLPFDAVQREMEMAHYLRGLREGMTVAVLGASSLFLVRALRELRCNVVVFDFSLVLLGELEAEIGSDVGYVCQDVTKPFPKSHHRTYDCVLADRLFNRFQESEMRDFLTGVLQILKDGAELRQTIRLGLYEVDTTIVSHLSDPSVYYDAATSTVDFSKVPGELDLVASELGWDQRVIQWYKLRSREKRLTSDDLDTMRKGVVSPGFRYEEVARTAEGDRQNTVLWFTKAVGDSGS